MSENGFLSRKDFFAVDALKTEVVELPELGEGAQVLARELNAFEVEELGYGTVGKDGKPDRQATKGMRLRMIQWAIVDTEGQSLFNKGDVQRLQKLPNMIIQRLATAVLVLSGLSETPAKQYECPECDAEFAVSEDLAKVAELHPTCVKCGVAFVEKGKDGESPNG